MRQVQVNLSFRRFILYRLSEALPDHSNLTRARQRLGEAVMRKVFDYSLRLCLDAGLVGGKLQSVDSTFVQANASLKSLQPRLVKVEAERASRRLFQLLDAAPSGDDQGDGAGPSGPKRPRRNDVQVSRTDPDSGIYGRSGRRSSLGYLVHFAVDSCKQVVTGVLTTAAHHNDVGQILPLVDQIASRDISVEAVAADRGYSSGAVYQGLAERGIEAFIPPLDQSAERKGYFGRDRFTFDAEGDRYLCPNGSWLNRQSNSSELRYRARPQDCAACPLRHLCTSGRARSLKVSFHEELLDQARRRRDSRAGRQAARQRRICSERTFGEAKVQHGLGRAHQRGQPNVSIQALLTAAVINLKRYLKAQTRVFPGAIALRTQLFTPLTLART
jgi:IS5 family transposase